MSARRHASAHTRAEFHAAQGVLLVLREPPPAPPPAKGQPLAVPANPAEGPEILVAVWDDGSVTALHGHVDLGQGIRTALTQIAAEELDVGLADVHMVLGDTSRAPNQGATIASASIQIHALPLRRAAAQARAWLVAEAARRWACAPEALVVEAGVVCRRDDASQRLGYGELVAGRHETLMLAADVALKDPATYRLVGQSMPRVDLPAKATGGLTYVHDMRVPGMLHGRVVRPPYAGLDAGDFVGHTLEGVDEASVAHIPGLVAVVTQGDFVGVVAEREDQAERAMRELAVRWRDFPAAPPLDDLAGAIRRNPSTRRLLLEQGEVDAALAAAVQPMDRTYVWPYQLHASIGPSCALADWRGEALTVWAGTQNPHVLRADLSKLTGLADTAIDIVRMEAAGCYGRNCADDVAADAALLSRAVGRPVRVQLTREQEHAWEPKGAAQLMEVRGGLDAQGAPVAYDFQTSYPSNGAPTLALLLTGTVPATATAYEMGDRTAVPPYHYDAMRVVANDMAPILRASWLRGVSALPNSFAHESYIDELASAAGVDPVEYRLRHLPDERAAELVRSTAARAGWLAHTRAQQQGADGDWLKGQGFAYARYIHSKFPGFGAAWSAWVADVQVHRVTGEVHVNRVVVGHDAGMMVNPAGVQHQIHGNVLQTTSRALKEQVIVDPVKRIVESREWGSYPILSFREVPVVEVMMMPRPGEPPLGAGESSSVPGTAAIANAIYDATGVRFRQPPFTPEVVRAALNPLPPPPAAPPSRRRPWFKTGAALVTGVLGVGAALLGVGAVGVRGAIAPVQGATNVYAPQVIERGRQLAALGACEVCHTVPGGTPWVGGRAMTTPFGTVYTTNLTPDAETGLGRWSFTAFQRAMREGISHDGRALYPAFPYTSYTRTNDDDLLALYAYLQSLAPVRQPTPAADMRWPFSMRPLMGLWNALNLQPGAWQPDAQRNAQWNRGAYLVEGLGHCSACHSPRNALGAERGGQHHLAGALVDGWEAPPLTALARQAPVPWSEAELYRYLRTGHTLQHGVATGPMAPIVAGLTQLPEDDVRAMAHYLASFNGDAQPDAVAAATAQTLARADAVAPTLRDAGQRAFDSACGACHGDGGASVQAGRHLPLALNSNLHSDRPDNLMQVMLWGGRHPATPDIAYMQGFASSLSDDALVAIARHLRARYASERTPWSDEVLFRTVQHLRSAGPHDEPPGVAPASAVRH